MNLTFRMVYVYSKQRELLAFAIWTLLFISDAILHGDELYNVIYESHWKWLVETHRNWD